MNRGNLAIQEPRYSPVPEMPVSPGKERLMLASKRRRTEDKQYLREKTRYHSRAQTRRKRGLQIILSVLLITAMLAFLLYNQSRVVELSMANSSLLAKIQEAQVASVQKESEILQLTDIERIRSEAAKYGFREPGPDQVVYLSIPKQDKLLLSPALVKDEAEAELASYEEAAYNNIENYFRARRP